MAYLDDTGVTTLTSELKSYADDEYLATSQITSEYSSSTSYVPGDYCVKNGILYKCNTATGSSGETWDSTHWDTVTVINELLTVKSIASAAQSAVSNSVPKTGSITLSSSWTAADPSNISFTQSVTLTGRTITSNTKVDLHPTTAALVQMVTDEVNSIFITNSSGTLTATAIGAAPTTSLAFQYVLYETTS